MLAAAASPGTEGSRQSGGTAGGGAGGAFPALPPASWQIHRTPCGIRRPADSPAPASPPLLRSSSGLPRCPRRGHCGGPFFFSIRDVGFVELQGPGRVARKAPGRKVAGLGCRGGAGAAPVSGRV